MRDSPRKDSVLHCSPEQPGVLVRVPMTGLVHLAGYVFGRIDIAALFASPQLGCPVLDVGLEIVRVVESGDDDVSSLVSIGVIAIVRNNPATNAVVVGIHHAH
jgi:hypothetical protein